MESALVSLLIIYRNWYVEGGASIKFALQPDFAPHCFRPFFYNIKTQAAAPDIFCFRSLDTMKSGEERIFIYRAYSYPLVHHTNHYVMFLRFMTGGEYNMAAPGAVLDSII